MRLKTAILDSLMERRVLWVYRGIARVIWPVTA